MINDLIANLILVSQLRVDSSFLHQNGSKGGQMAFETQKTSIPERMIPVQRDLFADRTKSSWGHCGAAIDLSPFQAEQGTGLFVSEAWFAEDCMFSQRAIDGNTYRHEAKHIRNTGNMLNYISLPLRERRRYMCR